MGAYWKKGAKSRGRLLSSHVGDRAYLSLILQFSHRVTNKVAIEKGFSCILTITLKKVMRDGKEELTWWGWGCLFDTFGLGNGRFFGGERLLEEGRLFEEIRYSTTSIPHSGASTKFNQDLDGSQNISERGFDNQKWEVMHYFCKASWSCTS